MKGKQIMERKKSVTRTTKATNADINAPVKQKSERQWIFLGGSEFLFKGKKIVRGQIFEAADSDIPKAFRDVIKPYDEAMQKEPAKTVEACKMRVRGGLYEVYGITGEKITSAPVSLAKANELLDSLKN